MICWALPLHWLVSFSKAGIFTFSPISWLSTWRGEINNIRMNLIIAKTNKSFHYYFRNKHWNDSDHFHIPLVNLFISIKGIYKNTKLEMSNKWDKRSTSIVNKIRKRAFLTSRERERARQNRQWYGLIFMHLFKHILCAVNSSVKISYDWIFHEQFS